MMSKGFLNRKERVRLSRLAQGPGLGTISLYFLLDFVFFLFVLFCLCFVQLNSAPSLPGLGLSFTFIFEKHLQQQEVIKLKRDTARGIFGLNEVMAD